MWHRTTVADRAHVLHGIVELLRWDREEVAQLESRHTGMPLCRIRVDAKVATRYFEFYANTIESFYAMTSSMLITSSDISNSSCLTRAWRLL